VVGNTFERLGPLIYGSATKVVLHKFNCTRQLHDSLSNVVGVQVRGRSHRKSYFVKNQFKLLKLIIS
jgi:hypothetical protein